MKERNVFVLYHMCIYISLSNGHPFCLIWDCFLAIVEIIGDRTLILRLRKSAKFDKTPTESYDRRTTNVRQSLIRRSSWLFDFIDNDNEMLMQRRYFNRRFEELYNKFFVLKILFHGYWFCQCLQEIIGTIILYSLKFSPPPTNVV